MTAEPRILREPTAPPQDLEAEQNVLGTVMLSTNALDPLRNELHLASEHFYRTSHGAIYNAMIAVADAGAIVDPQTLGYELRKRGQLEEVGGMAAIEFLAGSVPAVGNFKHYARTVIEMHDWRLALRSVYEQVAAIARMDRDALDAALRQAVPAMAGYDGLLTPENLADHWWDWYADKDGANVITTPWPSINGGLFGGFRPGDMSVWGGWPGKGKTTACDQELVHGREAHNLTVCAYVNEMDEIERISRTLAGKAGVSFERIMRRELRDPDISKVLKALPQLPFAIQPCAGWTVDAIASHLRRHKWGMALVDHATRIAGARDVSDWDRVSRTLSDAARQSRTHVMVICQLNRERSTTAARPMPVLRDLRSTGAWEQDARAVLLVHRREEIDRETDLPTEFDDGVIHLAKVNNGRKAAERVFLRYRTMTFEKLEGEDVPASLAQTDPF